MSTYAIIETGGKQYRVEKGQSLLVDRLPEDEGSKVALRPVMLRTDDDVVLDASGLEKVKIEAKIAGHERGEKVRVFKYKAKKGYRRSKGHRSELTRLEVTELKQLTRKPAAKKAAGEGSGAAKKAPAKKAPAKKAPARKASTKKAPAKKAATGKASSAAKAPGAKQPAAKKAPTKKESD